MHDPDPARQAQAYVATTPDPRHSSTARGHPAAATITGSAPELIIEYVTITMIAWFRDLGGVGTSCPTCSPSLLPLFFYCLYLIKAGAPATTDTRYSGSGVCLNSLFLQAQTIQRREQSRFNILLTSDASGMHGASAYFAAPCAACLPYFPCNSDGALHPVVGFIRGRRAAGFC
jgi:hypothetical protein